MKSIGPAECRKLFCEERIFEHLPQQHVKNKGSFWAFYGPVLHPYLTPIKFRVPLIFTPKGG